MALLAGARSSARLILSPSKRLFYLHHIAVLQQCDFYSAKATTTTPRTQQSTKLRTPKSSETSSQTLNKQMEAMAAVWPKPQAIPFQPKVANFVNLVGNVKLPVRFQTDSEGKHFTDAVISLMDAGERGSLSIPVVFEGYLAHVVACHVKEDDCVFVSGKLSGSSRRGLLNDSLHGKVHVLAENINFVLGFEKKALGKKMGASFPDVEIDELDNVDTVNDNVDSNKVVGIECDTAEKKSSCIETVAESVVVEGGNVEKSSNRDWGSGNKMKDVNHIKDLWDDLVKNPQQWWDYRGHKSNGLVKEKFPDFKHKKSGEPLWISSAPKWILAGLGKLEFDVKEMKTEKVSGGSERKQGTDLDNSWKNLVENPDKWWDNRASKKNSRAPDFKHKDTGEVLWLNSSPDWALSKLPPVKGGQKTSA